MGLFKFLGRFFGGTIEVPADWKKAADKFEDDGANLSVVGGASSYSLGDDGRSITCLRCNMTSHHPEDVRHRFCGNCHRFHKRPRGF